MVELVQEKFQKESVDQYKIEERSIVAKRLISYHDSCSSNHGLHRLP